MQRFLRKTWELWYWAMFCPSKLQQRMNEWQPSPSSSYGTSKAVEGLENFAKTIQHKALHQFMMLYLLLLLFFSLPLVSILYVYGQPLDWLLLPLVLLSACDFSFLLPLSLHIPLLATLIYYANPKIYSDVLILLFIFLPLTVGLAIVSLTLIFTLLLCQKKSKISPEELERVGCVGLVVVVGVGVLVGGLLAVLIGDFIGSWVENFVEFVLGSGLLSGVVSFIGIIIVGFLPVLIAILTALGMVCFIAYIVLAFMAFIVETSSALVEGSRLENPVVIGLAISVGVSLWLSGVVALLGGVSSLLIGIATLPFPLFIISCWLIASSLSTFKTSWLWTLPLGILIIIGFQNLQWRVLLAAPVVLIGYYRLLPDYLILAVLSLLSSISLKNHLCPKPLKLLYLLPPHTTELLWVPLPNHDRILAAAFRTDTSAALATFQQMQASPLPGLPDTIKQALPQIVADQLAAVDTIGKLILTAQNEHPLLPLLVPSFYQQDTELQEQPSPPEMSGSRRIDFSILSKLLIKVTVTAFPPGISLVSVLDDLEDGTDINKLLPRLQAVAKDINATLNAGSAPLRDRGLERILNNLLKLQLQLPGFGLKAHAIKRWQPVIERWQRVIELELEQQQKQSQGELLNPFQYGNPLRRNRTHLFKGRQAFADNIVRLVLDRNRPTLALHGPRRCGKSSFLLNLPRLLPSDMLPIYLDMQSAAITTDEAAFCQGLVRAINKDSRSQGVELPAIPQRKDFLDTPYIALEDWLEQAVPKLGDRRLLLNLDEFEKIGSAINEGRMSLRLFDQLRHLIQHYDQLGFLFSGVQTLDELGPNWSSYFISVVPIEMLYLEAHEAEDLLVNPDPEFTLRYDTGIVEEILTLTRCHPYLLQLIGWSLVKLANENHTQLVTSNLLEAAIPETFTNGQPYFTNIWTEFTGTSPAEVAVGQELLLVIAQGYQTTLVASDEAAQAARRRLLHYHVIEHINGSDRFEVPLIERWVRERAIRN